VRNAKFWIISLKINFEVKIFFLLSQSDSSFTPASFGITPTKSTPIPVQQELEFAPHSVWKVWRRATPLSLQGRDPGFSSS